MSDDEPSRRLASRRGFLTSAAGLAASAGIGLAGDASAAPTGALAHAVEPFWGPHQGGIVTAPQRYTYFTAFDIVTTKRAELAALLRRWTEAAARMAAGETAAVLDRAAPGPGADTAEALGLPPARLTVTFGFGAGLFIKDGKDRFGLAAQRPEALVDLPKFPGDQLVETRSDGDLSIQACADDPQVAFHAVRQLARLAYDVAQIRWAQAGFIGGYRAGENPRNLMGFKDGTNNPDVNDAKAMAKFVWAAPGAPRWMEGGSYVVARRARMALEHWDRMNVAFQEQTFGRRKYSGAPLGGKAETDPPNLDANDSDGSPVIPENAHIRLASAAMNDGARILRRSYSYNDGVNFIAERWPPWRQAMEYDAGLLFVCYQSDPRTGFIKIFERLSRFDMMNQFVTNTGGGLFACPGGAAQGSFIGQHLVE